MARMTVLNPTPRNRANQADAADVACGLAAVRRITLRKFSGDDQSVSAVYSKTDVVIGAGTAAGVAGELPAATQDRWSAASRSTISFTTGDRARAIAEIEHAYVALRRTEPALEAWPPEGPAAAETRNAHSVWVLIGGIWVSTFVVVTGAVGAMVYLLG